MRRFARFVPVVGLLLGGLAAVPRPSAAGTDDLKPYTEKVPGSDLSFEMIPIPAGQFVMGSPPAEKDRGDDESPQHPVGVGAFWMAKLETSWNLYDLYWK